MLHLYNSATLVYQATLLVLVIVGLVGIRRRPDAWRWLGSSVLLAAIAVVLPAVLAREKFLIMRLAAYGLFLHLGLWLIGSAVLVWRRRRWLSVLSASSALSLAVVAADAFLVEPTWLEVSHYELRSPKLSRPVRIVVLADLQTDQYTEYEQQTLRRVMAEKPDLVLLAGDYLQAPPEQRKRVGRELNAFMRQLPLEAPLGVFAVRGNVDRGDWTFMFQDTKVHAAQQTETFDLGPIQLTCLSGGASFDYDPPIPEAPAGKYHVVLGHSPSYALGSSRADLMLAGHTHGGQVRLPLVGPITTLSDLPRRYASGLSDRPTGGKLLVSRGTGMERENAPRLRFLCRPELVVIDLLP
jgi:predicted MPP superfamily phosphohydrolase